MQYQDKEVGVEGRRMNLDSQIIWNKYKNLMGWILIMFSSLRMNIWSSSINQVVWFVSTVERQQTNIELPR